METLALTRSTTAKITPFLTLALVFLCGSVAGALVMSVAGHNAMHSNHTLMVSEMSIAEWRQQLDLTDDQARRLTSILDDFSRYYDNLLADGNTRILQILNEDQKHKFKEMMHKHQPK